jgi:NADPH:quinone reductase-like Zn-dependent oxidoreductase
VVDDEADEVTSRPERYDVVLDVNGHENYFSLLKALRPSGPHVSTCAGAHKVNLVLVFAAPLQRHRKARFAFPRRPGDGPGGSPNSSAMGPSDR